jgi:hypothetical protein
MLNPILSVVLMAQITGSVPPTHTAFIHVDAPAAQRLIVEEKRNHPEIAKLGLHAIAPSGSDNVIIASDNSIKIGKISSANDLRSLAEGKPIATRIDKDRIFDLLIPVTDASGGSIGGGFLVMEVPFSVATDEQQALHIGISIRDEVQSKISSRAGLFER